jgi:NADH:ubiquinone oxidoreductase subunit 6 (subunit J)
VVSVLSLLTFAGLFAIVSRLPEKTAVAISGDTLLLLGNALVAPDLFVLPFEVASILLLAALVGAVYVAVNRK